MKKFTLLITVILLMVMNLSAEDRQFYFIAKEARLGSLSTIGSNEKGVYLRWDLIEGNMPTDIVTISLLRAGKDGNTTLLSVGANDIMDSASISKLFQKPKSQRGLFELIDAISKNDSGSCSGANISNIGVKVEGCLQNKMWSFLASRVNFDVARARYRAYLDTTYDKSAGKIKYYLIGKDTSAKHSLVLGEVTVDLSTKREVLAAKDLKQVIESHCNDNRYGLDDARVALNWKNGGANSTEFFANGLMVSGYDIYYTTVTSAVFSESVAAKTDIAKLVKSRGHNALGAVDLSDLHLKKANETLITIGEKDANKSEPLYIESKKELQARSFKPGEKRFYFLVPRDFTGNYGPTVFKEVEIPDLLPPATPINPRVIEKDAKAMLIWDSVNFQNYANYHKNDMHICSTKTIVPNGRVKFIDKNEECSTSVGIVLNFNVAKYYIYRFESAAEAASFEDSNLDGYNDAEESYVQKSDVEKCKLTPSISGAKNYLVRTFNQTTAKTMSFQDATAKTGKVYWYRMVSVTPHGIISQQTAPIRAFIPTRKLLAAPDLNVTYWAPKITLKNQEPNDRVVFDEIKKVKTARLFLQNKHFNLLVSGTKAYISQDVKNLVFTNKQTSEKAYMQFVDMNENVIATRSFIVRDVFTVQANKDGKRELFTIINAKKYFHVLEEEKKLVDGQSVPSGCVTVNFDNEFLNGLNGKGCIETSIAIGNRRYILSNDCHITVQKEICQPAINGDLVSVGVRKVMYNGLYSGSSYINFVPVTNMKPPHKPSLIGITFDKGQKQAVVGIRPQIEKVTGTILSFYKEDNKTQSFMQTITHVGKNNAHKDINATFTNLGVLNDHDVWCVKGKTIGLDGQTSEWSSPICKKVVVTQESEDNLGWPSLGKVAYDEEKLAVSFNSDTQRIELKIGDQNVTLLRDLGVTVNKGDYSSVIAEDKANKAQSLRIIFYKNSDDKEEVERVTIDKYSDNKFYLPSKLEKINNNDNASRIHKVTLEFISNENKPLLDTLEIKGDLIMKMNDAQLEINHKAVVSYKTKEPSDCTVMSTINRLNRRGISYVLYRQTISNGVASNFVQVTPLIEEASCKNGTPDMSNNLVVKRDGIQRSVYIVDRYPYIVGDSYRYAVVMFDAESGEPVSYRLTSPDTLTVREHVQRH